jgi:hypothetical protein
MRLPNLGDLVKDNQRVRIAWYRDGEIWYRHESGFEFPIKGDDLKGAVFKAEDKAILFMRWIRKHLEYLQKSMEEAGISNAFQVSDLKPGDLIQAEVDLDPDGADVQAGTWGVVFGKENCYGDGAGPIVRWFTGEPLGVCNIYKIKPSDIDEDDLPPNARKLTEEELEAGEVTKQERE